MLGLQLLERFRKKTAPAVLAQPMSLEQSIPPEISDRSVVEAIVMGTLSGNKDIPRSALLDQVMGDYAEIGYGERATLNQSFFDEAIDLMWTNGVIECYRVGRTDYVRKGLNARAVSSVPTGNPSDGND